MALSTVKFRLCLVAFTLFLACVSVGLGAEGESLGSGVGADNGCVNGCEELKGKNVDEFAACAKKCGVNQKVTEICRQWCQVAEKHGAEQQRRCRQACEERLREQERGEDVEEYKRRDPEREREEQRRREHEREERRRREREREHERGRGHRDENERDPEHEREERRREEQRREQEQHRREQERRGKREDEDDENQRDPDWRREQERREQERERRERQRREERDDEDDENQRDPDRRREQERREQERRRREQERERRERQQKGEREVEDDENQRDPDWRREQERREQERERRERQRREERDDEDDENQRDPDWRREQERREQERRRREQEREGRERQRRGEREDEDGNQRDPDWRREQERREQERRRREQEQREREWEREHGRRGSRDENQRGQGGREEQRSREEERKREERQRERQHGGRSRVNQVETRWTEQEQRNNPYYFQERQFQSRFRSDEGHWRVLERFSERSELLKGIKNQRFAILEARPQSFIIPHHLDAESVLIVVRGRATITTVVQQKRETRKESYKVERGDVMTIPAGTTVYLANQENEDLQIAKLIQPVNKPGEFKDYLSGGGEAQAYYSVFSNDVLEAALNIPRDRLERIFKQKSEMRGKIVRASQEQLRGLSQRATSVRRGGQGARAVIKLESQTPVYSNQYGQMFEACPDEFTQLRRTDVATAVLDIKQGGMMVPHFNSRATWVVFISEGTGSFEMGCPHIQGGQWQRERREEERHGRREEERSGRIERVAGRLSQGGVLVIPAGHPIAIMASPNENLRLVGFGINAENNQRNFLAGRENIMNEVDREAKELAFNVEGKQAEEIFKSQKESFFTEGPEGGRRRSMERSPLMSILKLAGYF
ncbi:vicilin Car i 2.0101 [Benincasa hispida]|uniref:vicilin Car i 2.0101 n=1 Tax=Benincasa hispida TaxID=102211 RepID=UPI0019016084|nr:vicilin Car i 2.0101 [Benincasa hispida]